MTTESEERIFESLSRDYAALHDELNDAHGIISDLEDECGGLRDELSAVEAANAFDDYQEFTSVTAIYPRADKTEALTYLALGLASEAGEVAGKLKKVLRDKSGILDYADRIEINKEVGDCLWYLARILDEMGYSLAGAARANRDKLTSRALRGVIGGSGDNR